MTESAIQVFHDSFQRCMNSPRGFFDVFYDDFLGSSPEVSAKFAGTDFVRQKQMLKMSLYVVELVVNAARIRDPKFDEDTELSWREAMQPGVDFIVSLY